MFFIKYEKRFSIVNDHTYNGPSIYCSSEKLTLFMKYWCSSYSSSKSYSSLPETLINWFVLFWDLLVKQVQKIIITIQIYIRAIALSNISCSSFWDNKLSSSLLNFKNYSILELIDYFDYWDHLLMLHNFYL